MVIFRFIAVLIFKGNWQVPVAFVTAEFQKKPRFLYYT
jgi:hypothetical protein